MRYGNGRGPFLLKISIVKGPLQTGSAMALFFLRPEFKVEIVDHPPGAVVITGEVIIADMV